MTIPSHKMSCLARLLLLCSILPVTAEIRPFDIIMKPTQSYIHYTDGYIRGPGSIDLSDLTFQAVSEAFVSLGDDYMDTDDPDMNGGNKKNKKRQLQQKHNQQEQRPRQQQTNEGGIELDAFMLDMAVFHMTDTCAKNQNCDWTQFGVGARNTEGDLRWCCSQDAIDYGMCSEEEYGRLIVNQELLQGQTGSISVPTTGESKKRLRNGKFSLEESGRYVVVFANCNDEGRDIHVWGHSVWESTHGYLPGELYGFMYFYILLAVVYAILMAWFGLLMKANEESRIPIEKWILMTIIMGFSEMFFRSCDYFLWNVSGSRPNVLLYAGIIVGALKRGWSRALLVMVSLGWGVVKDSLGSIMNSIVVLAASYIGVSAFRDLMMEFAEEDLRTLSYEEEAEIYDVVTILTFVISAIDVIFILWVLDALNGTMQWLENNSQLRKLARYLRLRTILLCAILFAIIWVVFSLVDTYDEDGIVREEHAWVVDGAFEANYLFILVGICILWRPNPSAQHYSYHMELPASGGEDGETELELSGVVPSAMDDDEEENENGVAKEGTGYADDTSFTIDDGDGELA